MSSILYNGFLVGLNQPDPLVTRTSLPLFNGNGKSLGAQENFQLIGQLTGCYHADITGAMSRLTNIFSKDFGTLVFQDNDGFSVSHSGARINNINFDQSVQVGIQDYTVDISVFPQSYFEHLGVIEKENSWSVSQEQNGNLTVSHTISAKGTNTAPLFGNALTNAKNFVLLYTGLSSLPPLFPFFISGFSGTLDNRSETIDRLEGKYTIVENYIARTGSGVSQELTVDLQSGTDGIITVGVNGFFKVGNKESFNLVRSAYSGFDAYATATGVYDHYRNATGLQRIPLSSGISEEYNTNTLSFDITFNDWPQVSYKHTYNVQITSGDNQVITASIDGTIEGIGKLPLRYDRAYQFFTGLNIFGLVNPQYIEYVGAGYPYVLKNIPIESGVSNDRFQGTISYNAAFDNKTLPLNCSGIKVFDVAISKQNAVRVVSPISIPHSVSGLDSMDLLYNSRAIIGVQGRLIVEKPRTYIDATGYIAQYINNKFFSQFLASGSKTKIRLDSVNVEQTPLEDGAGFNIQYSFDEPLSYDPSTSYIFITGLFI